MPKLELLLAVTMFLPAMVPAVAGESLNSKNYTHEN